MRGFLLYTTTLPQRRLACVIPAADDGMTIYEMFLHTLGGDKCTNDYIMSGHTSQSLLATIWVNTIFRESPSLLSMASTYAINIILPIEICTLLYYRWHYTVDVYIAIVSTLAVVHLYYLSLIHI